MTLYMTLLCICFRYYLFSIGLLISPKIMIIMYFGHHFPLTSHIRGHLLSTQMALLHSSANNSLCWYTKGHFRIEICQNTIDGHDMGCIYPSTSLPFYFSKCRLAYTNISIETRVHTRLFSLTTHVLYVTISITTRVQIYTWVSFKRLACHTRVAYINSRIHIHSTLKNINHDLWILVGP